MCKYTISNQSHETSILLSNFIKNIKHGISGNISDWIHALLHEERWMDGQAAGEFSCSCLQLFCESVQTLNTSLKTSPRS